MGDSRVSIGGDGLWPDLWKIPRMLAGIIGLTFPKRSRAATLSVGIRRSFRTP